MSTTIRELICANLLTTLQTITVVNGYENTVTNISRLMIHGDTVSVSPGIVITAGAEAIEHDDNGLVAHTLAVAISLFIRQEESTTTPVETPLNSLLGDIHKALQVDHTRGGYARDTNIVSVTPLTLADSDQFYGYQIVVEVFFKTPRNDMTVAA